MADNEAVTGVVLHAPEGMRLVMADGSKRLRRVMVTGAAGAAIGLAGRAGDYASFLERIRSVPMTTVFGRFVIASADTAPRVIATSNLRPATEAEVRAAIAADVQLSINELRAGGCVPTMSAEELMELTRGNDEGEMDIPSSPRPL